MQRSEIQEKQRVKASNPVLRCTSHRLLMIIFLKIGITFKFAHFLGEG